MSFRRRERVLYRVYIDIGLKRELCGWMDRHIYEGVKTRQNRGTASFSTWILIFIHHVVPLS